jgi:hypothetical protein
VIDALLAGRLVGPPVERFSRNGTARYAAAKLCATSWNGEVFVNVVAYAPPLVASLLRLGDGDSLAIAGEVTPKAYVNEHGKAVASLDIVVHALLTNHEGMRKRRGKVRNGSDSGILSTLSPSPLGVVAGTPVIAAAGTGGAAESGHSPVSPGLDRDHDDDARATP